MVQSRTAYLNAHVSSNCAIKYEVTYELTLWNFKCLAKSYRKYYYGRYIMIQNLFFYNNCFNFLLE